MKPGPGSPFESIESAHDFVTLLSETVLEAKKEIDSDLQKELGSKSPRHREALRLVSYNLEKLAVHMKKSCRILNDLRSLRRLLTAERTVARVVKLKPAPAALDIPVPVVQSAVPTGTVRPSSKARAAVAA